MFYTEGIKYSHLQEALKHSLDFIKANHPDSLRKVILFGSCAREDETENSDIDLCLVFSDDTNLTSRQMLLFKGYLRCIDEHKRDIIFCTNQQLESQKCLLYKRINRDGKILLELQ